VARVLGASVPEQLVTPAMMLPHFIKNKRVLDDTLDLRLVDSTYCHILVNLLRLASLFLIACIL
jgi:hypothetical protein